MSAKTKTLRVLELHRNQWLEHQLLQLDTNWILRFILAPGIYAENVRVFTDFPDEGELYVRGKLRELSWKYKGKDPRWDPDRYIDLDLISAGAYRFVVTLGNVPSSGTLDRDELTSCGFFLVTPNLGYSPESIACQTVITKLLGPLSEWRSRLAVAYHSGYNMVHFTPIQKLGSSKSAYSIANQLKLDPAYLPSKYMYQEVDVSYINRCGVLNKLKVDSALLEVEQLITHMRNNWGMLSIVDLVWNHTSFDTPWLIEHPEAGYNLVNSPHLHPAYAMDVALYQFSLELVAGTWASMGLQPYVQSEHDIQLIHMRLLDTVLPQAKLWEYFCVDVDAIVEEFRNTVYRMNGGEHPKPEGKSLHIIQDPHYRRLGSSVDADLTLELFNVHMPGAVCFEERIEACCVALRNELCHLNNGKQQYIQDLVHCAVNNLAADIRYQFLEAHGPKRREVTPTQPLFRRYFHVVGGGPDLSWLDMEGPKGKNVLALNGWVMDADPLVNFAEEGSQVYLKRELIVWSDSVKLRYGNSPSDSPWLWTHMTHYTQTMAWLFAGFRLDNCHNTPIHVAEALLDAAREVKPNLYLLAELFTSSEEKDNYFVNRLGINTLIREAMSAGIPRELGRLVYKYGGTPVASFFCSNVLKPSISHAMFVDATHDNDPGHIPSRSIQDVLPNTALVAIASCASSSCRGYDELVPHQINVVKEDRHYAIWNDSAQGSGNEVGSKTGIIAAKVLLNQLHVQLASEGFKQIYVDQVTEEIVAVTRHCSATHRSYILMAHTAFHPPPDWATPTEDRPNTGYNHVPPLSVQGRIVEIFLEARMVKRRESKEFFKSPSAINGLETHFLEMSSHISLSESRMCQLMEDNSSQEVIFNDFAPGSIIVFEVELLPGASHSVQVIRSFLGRESTTTDGKALWNKLSSSINILSPSDMNYALYRCDNEEKDDGRGGGVYVVPGAGAMVYCGLQGTMSMLQPVRDNNDLGHPLCDNLRAGDWLAGYTINRLKQYSGTKKMADILGVVLEQHLSNLPRYLIPCYFDAIITLVYTKLKEIAIGSMNSFVRDGSSLVKALTMGSFQLHGETCSASLPSALPGEPSMGCLAAGLPHFSTGFMRCWGRDTFISLRGLLMTTGRFSDARAAILGFAACLRHGLIPNLLSGGQHPRYNCRDATWWWLQSIQDYYTMAPSGADILLSPVRKLFVDDDADVDFDSPRQVSLVEIMQEALECHARGISFRERGAGPGLDRDMTMPGFNVTAGVNLDTGFVYGGNANNCGTWMDKVGESAWAGNKGVPATPRDGSAVELVSLCFSAVDWLAKLHDKGQYPHSGVSLSKKQSTGAPSVLTYAEWAQKIKDNFERHFWIPEDKNDAVGKEGESAGYIHRTGMYKDTVGSTHRYTDYQLRPNFPIGLVVAPDLFTPERAWAALKLAQDTLVGPLGMKTLDPHDWQYNGFYINSVDSGDPKTARGMNYHQGPEWLWVTGYFLRARLAFAKKLNRLDETVTTIHQSLSKHAQALQDSPWQGLPELTNEGGADCMDSCPVQAWTMACLLDVLYDLSQSQNIA